MKRRPLARTERAETGGKDGVVLKKKRFVHGNIVGRNPVLESDPTVENIDPFKIKIVVVSKHGVVEKNLVGFLLTKERDFSCCPQRGRKRNLGRELARTA